MPACPQCGKQWPEGYAVCPEDGVRLAPASTGSLALATSSAGQEEELALGSMAGEYRIEQKLGQGGMGAVYGARHPLIGKRAAIKVITRAMSASQEAVDRFVREAQAVNQIGHPNIVDVFGFGKLPDGRSFFVMEWLQGETLRERMLRELPLGEALEILEQIATALQAAHDAGVLHRDLKPDNVYLVAHKGGPAQVKLLDFGLAKLQGEEGRMDHTRTGVVMGTPLYLSPEQAKGIKVDLAADVYSLGAIAYEMCSGHVPFTADSAVEVMAKHISERVVPLFQVAPHTPPALDSLVLAMLDKEPSRRPLIAAVREQLAAIRAQLGAYSSVVTVAAATTAAPTSSVVVVERPRGRKRRVALFALAGVALAAAGAGTYALVKGGGGHGKSRHRDDPTAVVIGADPDEPATPTPPKEDPPKPEPPKPEPAKPEPPKPVTTKPEPTKPEPTKPEPTKPEPTKPEPTKPVTPKPDPGKKPPTNEPPEKQLATLTVVLDGVPRGRIVVDGKVTAIAVTETTVELPPGEHKIRGDAARFLPTIENIRLEPHQKKTIKLVMKPRPRAGVQRPLDEP